MGWSNGSFTRVHDWTDDEANDYDIESSRMDEEDDNFASGINSCLHKGGQNTPTANLPMGGFKHTGVALATSRDEYATCGQVQDGKFRYGVTGGSLNAYTLTLTPAPPSYVTGQVFHFYANRTNSGVTTLNVNSLGAKEVYSEGASCSGDEIVIDRVYSAVYDGTRFHLLSSAGGGSGVSYGGAKICLSSSQSIPHYSAWARIGFLVELYDDGPSPYYFDGSHSWFIIPANGRYRLSSGIVVQARPAGTGACFASLMFRVSGTNFTSSIASFCLDTYSASLAIPFYMQNHWEGILLKDDTVELCMFQSTSSGVSLNVYGNSLADVSSWMAIERIK